MRQDPGSTLREGDRDGAAYTARRPGDEGDLAVEGKRGAHFFSSRGLSMLHEGPIRWDGSTNPIAGSGWRV